MTGKRFNFDTEKTKKDLGMEFMDAEASIKDTVDSLIQHGVVPKTYPLGAVNVYLLLILAAIFLLVAIYFVL
jgi:hypothetical protein